MSWDLRLLYFYYKFSTEVSAYIGLSFFFFSVRCLLDHGLTHAIAKNNATLCNFYYDAMKIILGWSCIPLVDIIFMQVRSWLEDLLWEKKSNMDVYRCKGVLNVLNSDQLHTLQVSSNNWMCFCLWLIMGMLRKLHKLTYLCPLLRLQP